MRLQRAIDGVRPGRGDGGFCEGGDVHWGASAVTREGASSRSKALDRKQACFSSYLACAAMPELYRRAPQRKPAGTSIARMVAVAKAQMRSVPAFCEATSTLTTPMLEPAW